MQIKDKLLIVEDDKSIASFMRAILISHGYDAVIAYNGSDAVSLINSHCPDLILLDLGLPDVDGTNVIEAVRSWASVPIIVVSARTSEKDKVEALDKGADDYITKPFSPDELLARVRVALRHLHNNVTNNSPVFERNGLSINFDKHQVLIDGENKHLTQNEFKIVSLLSRYLGKVLTYDFILKELWGPQGAENGNQILRVNMANIRRKVEKNPADPKYIFTEVGVGYRMVD